LAWRATRRPNAVPGLTRLGGIERFPFRPPQKKFASFAQVTVY
jgi:hypothetical protein